MTAPMPSEPRFPLPRRPHSVAGIVFHQSPGKVTIEIPKIIIQACKNGLLRWFHKRVEDQAVMVERHPVDRMQTGLS